MEKTRKNPGLTWRVAAKTATAEARDAKQGPPRSEGVVPLEGEGAEGDAGGAPSQLGRFILQATGSTVTSPGTLSTVFQPSPRPSASYFTPLTSWLIYSG